MANSSETGNKKGTFKSGEPGTHPDGGKTFKKETKDAIDNLRSDLEQMQDKVKKINEKKLPDIERLLENSKKSNITTLALFTAIIALVLGYLNAAMLSGLNFWERIGILIITALFLYVFIFLIFKIVSPIPKNTEQVEQVKIQKNTKDILTYVSLILLILFLVTTLVLSLTDRLYLKKTTEELREESNKEDSIAKPVSDEDGVGAKE